MTRIGVQLHTFRNIDEDLPTVLHRTAEHGFEGVEFAHRFHNSNPRKIADALAETGLEPIGAHVGLAHLEREFTSLVDQYTTIGCSSLVIPHLAAINFISFDRIDRLAERLADLADRLASHGFELVIHNTKAMHHPVICQYMSDYLVESDVLPTGGWTYLSSWLNHLIPGDVLGTTGFEYLLEATEATGISFEIDVEHAVGVGEDPLHLFEMVGDRLFATHLCDGERTRRFPPAYRSTTLGDGYIDLDREVRSSVDQGIDWLIVEADEHPQPQHAFQSLFETVDASYRRVA